MVTLIKLTNLTRMKHKKLSDEDSDSSSESSSDNEEDDEDEGGAAAGTGSSAGNKPKMQVWAKEHAFQRRMLQKRGDPSAPTPSPFHPLLRSSGV